jgi:hypothetical protein
MKHVILRCLGVFTLLTFALTSHCLAFEVIVPDTGQNYCYDWEYMMCDSWHMEGSIQVCDSPPYCPEENEDFYGQDGNYLISPPSLSDNGNGIITDNLTGLMWEKKSSANEGLVYTYEEAVAYCENSTVGDYTDWRIPSRREFSTLLNYGRYSPSLDTNYFPDYTSNNVYYWTATDNINNANQNWALQISFGLFEVRDKTTKKAKIRCVRGVPEPVQTYTDNGNGTVTDNLTGLMWEQKTDDGGSRDKDNTYTWKDALAYCENLILGNYSDWRMPMPKEFERLVDLTKSSPPTIDIAYFPNTGSGLYWTGTTCSGCHRRKAFAEDFNTGRLYYGNKYYEGVYYENYVRCVRTAEPTAIELSTFSVSPKIGKVVIRWTTESETNNSGFNLYRSLSEAGEFIKINASLIPSRGYPTQGASYEFIDRDVKNRKTYYYKLEDIDLNGTSTMHGPKSATPRWILKILGK